MPSYSRNLIQGLLNPAYTQGMFAAGQNLGAIPGRLRAQQQKQQMGEKIASFDQNTPEGLLGLAQLYSAQPDANSKQLGAQYAKAGRELAIENEKTARFEARKGQVQTMLTNMGLDNLSEQVPNITEPDELGDIVSDMTKYRLDNMPTQTPAQRRQIAAQKGITGKLFDQFDLGIVPDKAFNDFMAGQRGGKIEYFMQDGEVKPFRTEGGQVWNRAESKWVSAETMGLRKPPPQVQKIENLSSTMAEKIMGEGVGRLSEGLEAAEKAGQSIVAVDRQLDLLESGSPITGYGAEFRKDIARLALQLNPDEMARHAGVEDSEEYAGLAAAAIADYITNLGSGTGLSDKDLEFTKQVTAADLKGNPEAMKRLLRHMRQTSINTMNKYNKLNTSVTESLRTEADRAAMSFFPTVDVPEARVTKVPEVNEPMPVPTGMTPEEASYFQ